MALATISDTELEGTLKNVYADLRVNAFPMLDSVVAQLPRKGPGDGFFWGGNGVRWNVKTERPVGATWSDAGYLPDNALVNEEQATAGMKRLYVTREIDKLAFVGTQDTRAAYRSILKKVIEEAKDAYKLAMSEAIQGDGTAVKALVMVVNSTTSIDVSSPYGISGAGQGGLHIGRGMTVAVLDASASDAVLGRSVVSAVSNSGDTATLTLATAVTGMEAGDKIVPCTSSDTAHNSAPDGLISMSNRGGSYATLNGLSATSFPHLAPLRMTAGTDTPDADLPSEEDIWTLQQRLHAQFGESPENKPDDFLQVTTTGLRHKIGVSFYGQREWAMAPQVELNGGFKSVRICGVPVLSDPNVPAGTFYLLHKPSVVLLEAQAFGQVGFQDANVWRPISGRDGYQTSYSHFLNFVAQRRNGIGSITGFTDTQRFTHVK